AAAGQSVLRDLACRRRHAAFAPRAAAIAATAAAGLSAGARARSAAARAAAAMGRSRARRAGERPWCLLCGPWQRIGPEEAQRARAGPCRPATGAGTYVAARLCRPDRGRGRAKRFVAAWAGRDAAL